MANYTHPTPEEFCRGGMFRINPVNSRMEARVPGHDTVYVVNPYGDEAVEIATTTGDVVAILRLDGEYFVPAGKES